MSMHIVGPALTTTSYKKRKEKITKAKQEELERGWRDRNQRLKQMGLPKETLEQYTDWVYGRGKKKKTETQNLPNGKTATAHICPTRIKRSADESVELASSNDHISSRKAPAMAGPCFSKPSPTYTGENIIGIAVLHKSCLQPIFNKQAAEDVAKMRR
jgi:hypothetical protein